MKFEIRCIIKPKAEKTDLKFLLLIRFIVVNKR